MRWVTRAAGHCAEALAYQDWTTARLIHALLKLAVGQSI